MGLGQEITLTARLSVRKVVWLLTLVTILLTIASFAGQVATSLVGSPRLGMVARMFDVNREANIPTWYASALLLVISLLLSLAAQREKRRGYALYWGVLAAVFLLLSLDEISQFHERTIMPLRNAFELSGIFYHAWVIPGAVFVLAVALFSLRLLRSLEPKTRLRFMLAAFLYVGASLGIELVEGFWDSHYDRDLVYVAISTAEEFLEMSGLVVFIYALLIYLGDAGGQAAISASSGQKATVVSSGLRPEHRD